MSKWQQYKNNCIELSMKKIKQFWLEIIAMLISILPWIILKFYNKFLDLIKKNLQSSFTY